MDSLTTQYLARALAARWTGRRVSALRFDRDARAVELAVDGSRAVRFPFAVTAPAAVELDAEPADALHLAGWTVRGVSAPEDDRRITVTFERRGKFRGSPSRLATLDIGFVPAARGARLRGDPGDHRIGARLPAVGAPRPVLTADAIERALRSADREALLAGRWMSPALLDWLNADPPDAAARYAAVLALPEVPPPCVGSLFGGEEARAEPAAPIDDRRARAIARMERELAAAAEAPRVRAAADRLRALGDAAAPAVLDLPDGPLPLRPRPGERAADAAERLHADARSMERALLSLPARIAALRAAPAPGVPSATPTRAVKRAAPAPARAYREYRSSGGLEIRVGRGAASNDHLTFHESSPDDVWLHARDAAGAHVVLRWTRDEPPPAKDLAEAAALAAWHSKSRGSTVVPVDWTRRKHVRKPRGGAPGLVMVERTKTVNARPSAALERRLRRG